MSQPRQGPHHHYVERTESGKGGVGSVLLGIILGLLILALLFFVLVMPEGASEMSKQLPALVDPGQPAGPRVPARTT